MEDERTQPGLQDPIPITGSRRSRGLPITPSFSCFEDAIFEAAQHAIDTQMTPLQFYKECFYAYQEALEEKKKHSHEEFRKIFRGLARSVSRGEGHL
jgi:hypothetical protein